MKAVLLATLALLAACATSAPEPGPVPGARTVSGPPLAELLAEPRLVLVFIDPQCPIANAYAPELQRLAAEYEPRGVRFALVHSDPGRSEAEVLAHAAAFGHSAPVVLDPEQSLATRTGATMTPEACVLEHGRLVYRGRIDDRFFALGKQRAAPTTRELRDALEALLSGRTPAPDWPPAIGCHIPPRR